MNIDSDELLARLRRDYPLPYQLCQQQVLIDKQHAEIQRLSAELAAARDQNATKVTGSATVSTPPEFTVRSSTPWEGDSARAGATRSSGDDTR